MYRAGKQAYQVAKRVRQGYKAGKQVARRVQAAIQRYNRGRKARSPRGDNRYATNQLQGISQHNDWASRPSGTIVVGRKESVVKTIGHFHLSHFYSDITSGAQGRQITRQGMELFNINQCLGVTSNAINNSGAWGTDPFTLNPYSTAPANAIYPGIAGVANEDKIFIKDVYHHLRISAMATIPMKVKVMWFLNKKDNGGSLTGLWSSLLDGTALGQGNNLAPTSLAGPLTFTPGKAFTNDIGRTPMQVPAFKKFWKLISSDQFVLQPGDEVSIKRKFIYNKLLQKSLLQELVGFYVPGYTIVPLILVEGSLVGISESVGVESTQCAPGSCKIGIFTKDVINFNATPINRYSIERNEPAFIRNDITDVLKQIDDTDQVVAEVKV